MGDAGDLQIGALAAHVADGLARRPKALSSAWLYDDEGSLLFERIMALPEYYPTRAELRVLLEQGDALAAALDDGRPLDLVEMGSGNGEKTLRLCEALTRAGLRWTYRPIDQSASALKALAVRFGEALPGAPVLPCTGDWEMPWPPVEPGTCRVAMFMGSNLGNLDDDAALGLLRGVRGRLAPADLLLVGLDLQKDPRRILAAYDDAQGVTARFNLNLLARINRELGADFDLAAFSHYACYNPLTGIADSFLVSARRQNVGIAALGLHVHFDEGEWIHTEQSRKYTPAIADALASGSGFATRARFVDPRDAYSVELWEAAG